MIIFIHFSKRESQSLKRNRKTPKEPENLRKENCIQKQISYNRSNAQRLWFTLERRRQCENTIPAVSFNSEDDTYFDDTMSLLNQLNKNPLRNDSKTQETAPHAPFNTTFQTYCLQLQKYIWLRNSFQDKN